MNNSDESEFSVIIDEDNFQDRADELDVLAELTGGKKFDEDEDEGGDDARISAVDGLDLKWDRNSRILTATALTGPQAGKVWKLDMVNFTEDKWDVVRATHDDGVAFKDATPLQKRIAAWDYVEQQCAQKLCQ